MELGLGQRELARRIAKGEDDALLKRKAFDRFLDQTPDFDSEQELFGRLIGPWFGGVTPHARGGESTRIHRRLRAASKAVSDEKLTIRPSRTPRVFARLVKIRKIQVLSEDRPSKPGRP